MMHIYFSYNSVPELASVPRAQRKAVIRKAARALAGTAEGRSQFRFFLGWLFFAAVSTALFISLAGTKLSSGLVAIVTGAICYLSYTFVFQFQVRRLRPHIRAILSTEPIVERE
ncbi:hypothetical protein [Paraburkholderia sp. BL25I1N1]|uniref:hypothetical protein n=1 Tax=Paraburkholderia sp. BL25I1N1 TaxID=1938804 RepID=UPI0011B1C8D9|nr:hypothetical protein [Paraburkholderia sp. BL25I1N1]